MALAELLQVEVAFSPGPGEVRRWPLSLPLGSTVRDAIDRCGVLAGESAPSLDSLAVGVWGVICPLDHPLRDRDRVELLRALRVDPKEARRLRYRNHGGRRKGAR